MRGSIAGCFLVGAVRDSCSRVPVWYTGSVSADGEVGAGRFPGFVFGVGMPMVVGLEGGSGAPDASAM